MHNQGQQLISLKRAKHRRGIALMLVMVAILVTGGMALAYFGSRDNSIAISSNVEASTRARAVAESGLDLAIAILETNADWRTNHMDGVLLTDFEIGGGIITLTLIDRDTSLPPTESTMNVEITVRAKVDELIQSAKANATVTPNEDEFDVDFSEFAIFAQSRIEIYEAASVMHWSASPISLQEQSLIIGTLATAPMSVIIDTSSPQSTMDLYTPSNASSMVTTSAMDVLEMGESTPFPSSPPAPTTGLDWFSNDDEDDDDDHESNEFELAAHSSLNNNFNSMQTDVQSGTYILDDLSLHSGETLAIRGDVTISIAGDFILRHAAILVDDDASLIIHVGGNVSIVTSYLGNNNQSTQSYMNPNNIQLFGHNESQWVFGGRTTLKGEIYAPESKIETRGTTTICGRIAADEVTLRGSSRLLYDPTLDHGGFADFDSSLYSDAGELHPELQQLTSLDPLLINEILQSLTMLDDGFENQNVNDWLSNPTERMHDVIYALIVYGVDAHQWEEFASELRWDDDRRMISRITR